MNFFFLFGTVLTFYAWVPMKIHNSLGFLVGIILCSILMSVIGSAVNTVIVCFAEGPAEFQRNHPTLSQKMRAAWLGAYPGSV